MQSFLIIIGVLSTMLLPLAVLNPTNASVVRREAPDLNLLSDETQIQRNTVVLVEHYQPRHVHISYGGIFFIHADTSSEMFITWSTLSDTGSSIVEYGRGADFTEFWMAGNRTKFTDNGPYRLTQFIHRVRLTNLESGLKYTYHCGSDLGWSELFYFRSMPYDDPTWLPRLAVYGDLGSNNAPSLSRLQREVQLEYYDAVIHAGDFAYDLNHNNGLIGDEFMEQIQPIAAYVPYMTCPGNHEAADNFAHYKNRFTMPGDTKNMYYSFHMGPIHFISFSTEYYYFLNYGIIPLFAQYIWLADQLKEATKPENRAVRPWIITFGHRPMYCSNKAPEDDCNSSNTRVRVGLSFFHWLGLENLFNKYGVDLAIWAHEHSYERLFPLYKGQVYNGSLEEPYRNPKALVHITTGSAGCSERHDEFFEYKPPWTAFRSTDYGYTRLEVINRTHLYLEQVSDDKNGAVIDSMTLIRENHAPYIKSR